MTEVDKKNNEIILDVLSRFSLADESYKHIQSIFASPDIDPVYGKHLGPDLRKRWPLDYKFLQSAGIISNEGYDHFNSLFVYYQTEATRLGFPKITEEDFNENKILWKKNTVKLKKILVEFFSTHRDIFYLQWDRNRSGIGLPQKSKQAINEDASLVEQYVIKANEFVGRFKISEKETTTELVMSNNPADWLMCSTKEQWTSCLGLESSHGYWAGIPFILDDKNRTMFYISSNKRRKSYLGIEVDGMNNRSWGLLDSQDVIRTIRWFPDSFLNLEAMKRVTGLDLKNTNDYDRSKYTIMSKIHFADGVAQTPYLDCIGVRINDKGEVRYEAKASGGVRSFKPSNPKEQVGAHLNGLGFEAFVKSNRPWFKFLYSKICFSCNTDINKSNPFNYGGRYYCDDCVNRLFYSCSVCNNLLLKEGETAAKKTPTSSTVCPACFNRYYTECKCCGAVGKKNEYKNGFCSTCIASDKIEKCKADGCESYFLKGKGINHLSDELGEINACTSNCASVIRDTLRKEKGIRFFSCPHCNSYHDERDGIVQFNGVSWCRKCVWKMADKKQMKFVFKSA